MGRLSTAKRNRDAGLRRVSTITRWTVAVGLAATGFFAGLASQVGRGSSNTATKVRATSTKTRHRSTLAPRRRGDDSGGDDRSAPTTSTPPTAPTQTQQPTSQQPPTVQQLPQQQPTFVPVVPQPSSSGIAPITSGAS